MLRQKPLTNKGEIDAAGRAKIDTVDNLTVRTYISGIADHRSSIDADASERMLIGRYAGHVLQTAVVEFAVVRVRERTALIGDRCRI